jgi:hypothetical protein
MAPLRENELPTANRIFLDREVPLKVFEDAAFVIPADRSTVCVFYGKKSGAQVRKWRCLEVAPAASKVRYEMGLRQAGPGPRRHLYAVLLPDRSLSHFIDPVHVPEGVDLDVAKRARYPLRCFPRETFWYDWCRLS